MYKMMHLCARVMLKQTRWVSYITEIIMPGLKWGGLTF